MNSCSICSKKEEMGYFINLQKSFNDIQKSVNINILKALIKEFRNFSPISTLREEEDSVYTSLSTKKCIKIPL